MHGIFFCWNSEQNWTELQVSILEINTTLQNFAVFNDTTYLVLLFLVFIDQQLA